MTFNPLRAISRHLYLRIWLTVIGSVVVLALGAAAAWRIARDSQPPPPAPTPREITVRNAAGEVVGGGLLRGRREPGQPLTFSVTLRNGESLQVELAPRPRRPGEEGYRPMHGGPGPYGGAPAGAYPGAPSGAPPGATAGPRHFGAPAGDLRGRPRPPEDWLPPWLRPPYGFVWMLAAVSLAVALALYPVVRRMTKRLEALQQGVQRWGEGELAVRLPEDGQDEVADLSRRFNAAAARIESLLESQKALLASQRSLLANASHELRSPLARIRMALELMGERPSAALRDELTRNIGELDQLIDEILLASRLDAREADLGSVESVDLTGIAVEECMRADVALHLPDGQSPVVVPGVAKLLRRLLRNLVENAKRHGGQGVEVSLRQQAQRAELIVSDRGPGVPAAERERIFEPFYRARGASERDGGVGLGLALVRSIAERHGGQVRCDTRPGGGAMFVVSLPL